MASEVSRRDFVKVGAVAGAGMLVAHSTAATAGPAKAKAAAPPPAYKAPTREGALRIASLNDLEAEAAKVIPKGAFAYISSGSDNEVTLRNNLAAFERIQLRPQYLVGKEAPDTSITLMGETLAMPVITAPMGVHGLVHASAELGTARGTAAAGTLLTVSTAANKTIEEIAAASSGPKWFQLYLQDDRALSRELIKRAETSGYKAIVFTIDAFAPGSSDEAARLGFAFPPSLPLVNSGTARFKASLSWDDVDFIKETTDLPLILKGVLAPDVAEKAIKRGVNGIQVSNHGGRQLDGVPAAIEALPAVAGAVKGRVPVIMDSGIRRGTDVFKAIALGANVVALGRPVLYGLALGGAAGVESVYQHLQAELARTMMIAGAATVGEINSRFIV
ncbi:alpha-hydroxy acid oxidase [Kaistia adipata]|uniref:alpha-hydroxy acid oxidase n=1 Tax=Kaistia adipata TaxID=166954 RepID=UPI0003FEFC46|nr:alpha-hydroxy acid oxidase [Kaistia adipata]